MKATLLFLAKFICLTAPLVWLWQIGGLRIYHALYSPIAAAIYEWIGLEGVATPARDRYINIVPFVALMALTPDLTTRRRLWGIAIGLFVLVLMHIAVNPLANPETLRLPRRVSLALDAAPFVLWVAIANQFVAGVMKKATGDPAAGGSSEGGDG